MDTKFYAKHKLDIPLLDREHWNLFALLEVLKSCTDKRLAMLCMDSLMTEWLQHIDNEMTLMRAINLPSLAEHEVDHTRLTVCMADLKTRVDTEEVLANLSGVIKLAQQKVLAHIDTHDAKYVRYLHELT